MTFTIGKNFHVMHVTADLRALDTWYYDVFAVRQMSPESYMAVEKRDGSLVLLGELCIETLAPAFDADGWHEMPLGRFFKRHGGRFHSLAWYVDDGMQELLGELRGKGVDCRVAGGGPTGDEYAGGPIFTNPRDTLTQLEFIPAPGAPGGPPHLRDPRYLPGWDASWWSDYHPLQVQKVSHVTISTYDLGAAVDMYVGVLRGTHLHEDHDPALGAQVAYVLIGDVVVQLAQPGAQGPLRDDMDRFHHGIHSLTLKVRDLDDAVRHLDRKGVRCERLDGQTVVTDPTTSHGCVIGFTTAAIPNDPRDDWSGHVDGPLPASVFTARP